MKPSSTFDASSSIAAINAFQQTVTETGEEVNIIAAQGSGRRVVLRELRITNKTAAAATVAIGNGTTVLASFDVPADSATVQYVLYVSSDVGGTLTQEVTGTFSSESVVLGYGLEVHTA